MFNHSAKEKNEFRFCKKVASLSSWLETWSVPLPID